MTGLLLPDGSEIEPSRAPLLEHLEEFRTRIIRVAIVFALAVGITYFFARDIYGFLVAPLAAADPATHRMIYTDLTEAFFTYLKLACFGGFILTFPILAWQLYGFMAPGLYKRERRVVVPFLLAAPVLFGLGAAMAYYLILPNAWRFFLHFESGGGETVLPIQLEARVSEYLDLVTHIILAFGISFQMPVILALLGRAGIVSAASLASARRFAILGIVLFAGVVTPPDVFSQLALAVPMFGLYEISILSCRMLERRRAQEE